ncbi:hypothetical protein C7G41_28680 [Bradyrhizobium sp. MOS002]|nr:hypothetical protein C7G41_28680 [Bradyrhizobium sp. MOS002]
MDHGALDFTAKGGIIGRSVSFGDVGQALCDGFPLVLVGGFSQRDDLCERILVRAHEIRDLLAQGRPAVRKLAEQLVRVCLEIADRGRRECRTLSGYLCICDLHRNKECSANKKLQPEPLGHFAISLTAMPDQKPGIANHLKKT